MKCSLGISNFLEEISNLSYSVVFLYSFALIAEEGFLISPCYSLVPGSSSSGSRVIRKWGRSQRLWKNTYLITDTERLEMDSVVGRLVEKKRLNNLDYME